MTRPVIADENGDGHFGYGELLKPATADALITQHNEHAAALDSLTAASSTYVYGVAATDEIDFVETVPIVFVDFTPGTTNHPPVPTSAIQLLIRAWAEVRWITGTNNNMTVDMEVSVVGDSTSVLVAHAREALFPDTAIDQGAVSLNAGGVITAANWASAGANAHVQLTITVDNAVFYIEPQPSACLVGCAVNVIEPSKNHITTSI